MLKIFTDITYLTPKNRGHVFPLLLDLYYKECPHIGKYYIITNTIDHADLIVLPLEYNYINQLDRNITPIYLDLYHGIITINPVLGNRN